MDARGRCGESAFVAAASALPRDASRGHGGRAVDWVLHRVRSAAARRMVVGWSAAVVVLAGCGGGGRDRPPDPSSAQLTPQVAGSLDRQFRSHLADSGIPGGASAAIVFPDGRVWASAAGNAVLEPPTPMTERTSISFDSVAKLATAALTLRLVEQGRLRLDDRIARWYPAWAGEPGATVRDLLGHTSGWARRRTGSTTG